MTLVVRHAALSDIGLHRKTNEDAFIEAPPLFVVCDGMGGALAGEVASQLAAETLAAGVAAGHELHDAATAANAAVFRRALENADHAGMGTTLTAMLHEDAVAHFVHIGDSRAYLLREGKLEQLSDDHSLVGEMMREGQLTAEEAAQHPHRSILSRALGTEPEARIDEFAVDLEPGDVFLLCSDGLSGPVPAATIRSDMARSDPRDAVKRLIADARKRGGPDNITALIVRFDAPPAAEAPDEAVTAAATAVTATAVTAVAPAGEAVTAQADAVVAPDAGAGDASAPAAGETDDASEAATVRAAAVAADGTAAAAVATGAAAAADGAADGAPDPAPDAAGEADTAAAAELDLEGGEAGPAADQAGVEPAPALEPAPPVRSARRLGCLAVVLLLLVLIGGGAALGLSTLYFVGADQGTLTVYSGVPASVGPVHLYAVYRRSGRPYAALDAAQRALVDAHAVHGKQGAMDLAVQLGMWP